MIGYSNHLSSGVIYLVSVGVNHVSVAYIAALHDESTNCWGTLRSSTLQHYNWLVLLFCIAIVNSNTSRLFG